MLRKLIVLGIFLALSCSKQETVTTSSPSPSPSPAPAPATTTTIANRAPAQDADDLLGLSHGAIVVINADSMESNHGPFRLIDEDATTTWVSAQDKPTGSASVIALPERCDIDSLQFDTAAIGLDSRSPNEVLVEMSDTSPTDGFQPIARLKLQQMKDGQVFPVEAKVPGRFLRITVQSNYGGAISEIGEVRAYGKKLTNTPLPSVTGAYETPQWGTMRLTQTGTTITGCYEHARKPLVGGIEGRVAKFAIDTESDQGPAIMVFSPDAKQYFGGFWKQSDVVEHPTMDPFAGKKLSDTPGTCPGEKSPEQEMAKALEDEKRLRLYGINFDSDSDRLRDESKPTLDLVLQVLKEHADWKVTIEGHTDSTSTAQHNQQLSEARANAVKTYLTTAGIDASRLTPAGLGATKPVASNDAPLGRAANRRVELVRE